MAVTTNYSWFFERPAVFLNNLFTAGLQSGPDVTANFTRTAYFGAWTDPGFGFQTEGRLIRADQTPLTDEFTINSTNNTGAQAGVDVAGLKNGNFVAVYADQNADPFGDLRGAIFTSGGAVAVADFAVATGPSSDLNPVVGALADGGFAVAYETGGSAGISARVFNANGTERPVGLIEVTATGEPIRPAIAGLTGGDFVVLYDDFDIASKEVFFRRYSAAGVALDAAPVLIDTAGVNQDACVVALADGGFAVAYSSDGWGFGSTEITLRIFNADGTGRTPALGILVNGSALGGSEIGDQLLPTITTLGTGHIVVGWLDQSGFSYAQVFDAAGNAVGANRVMDFTTQKLEFAGLGGGFIAEVLSSTTEDGTGNNNSIRTNVGEFIRTLTGDGANDTLVGINDGLREVYLGLGGNDVFIGGAGPDQFDGGTGIDTASYVTAAAGVFASLTDRSRNTGDAAGDAYSSIENLTGSAFNDTLEGSRIVNNTLDGGNGDDTVVYTRALDQYRIEDFGAKIVVAGAEDGIDTLISIEHLRFADATLAPVDDGNPLFDRLFYLSRNGDVFKADTTAFAHFNAFGWHEGRDPNPFFDVSAYLAFNTDVAASGVNPLDQYHLTGWRQGRDPGPDFDTTLYLLRNPDVAAAGVDPLAHYLQSGFSEGRQAFRAIGPVNAGGFDAEYYLFHNPDVAASHADPLAHFNAYGWHEGRNPNAFFDTAGYLSHYADVAAANVNPLDHYVAFGWHEGRDPSVAFDTTSYLSAYADVNAAHVNPLVHFLQSGIYEGRQAFADGAWG